jgi:hypothetical protein
MAQAQHYAAYNQETNRFGNGHNVVFSDRAIREIPWRSRPPARVASTR